MRWELGVRRFERNYRVCLPEAVSRTNPEGCGVESRNEQQTRLVALLLDIDALERGHEACN
jgi:hypothetical protein